MGRNQLKMRIKVNPTNPGLRGKWPCAQTDRHTKVKAIYIRQFHSVHLNINNYLFALETGLQALPTLLLLLLLLLLLFLGLLLSNFQSTKAFSFHN